MPTYLSVKNLHKYQHYKTRNPPWVKLHRNFWIDDKIDELSIPEKLLFLGCLTLASESENRVPQNVRFLSKRLGFSVTEPMLQKLLDLTLLCSASDSVSVSALSLSKHSASSPLASQTDDAIKKLATRKHNDSKTLADRTSKGFSPASDEVHAVADKWFPPVK